MTNEENTSINKNTCIFHLGNCYCEMLHRNTMKMPDIIKEIMLAPCGINYSVCYKHVGAKKYAKPCKECKSDIGKPEHCHKCNFKSCV